MLPALFVKVTTKSARSLGLGILLAALPFSLTASIVTVNFGITLNGLTGTGQFSYDPSLAATDSFGQYVNSNSNGLDSFDLTYNGATYNNTSPNLLDGPGLPTVFLPGNTTIQGGLEYGFLGLWVVSGSCTGSGPGEFACTGPGGVGGATILGLGRTTEAFLASGVTSSEIAFSGSDLEYNLGSAPAISEITGTISSESVVATPEPALFPLTALGLAGLWFVRRRKVTRSE
jgi:MYXO-CTERM domain-containing protein